MDVYWSSSQIPKSPDVEFMAAPATSAAVTGAASAAASRAASRAASPADGGAAASGDPYSS